MSYSPLIRKIILDLAWKYVINPSDVPEGRRWIRTPRNAILYETHTSNKKDILPNGDHRVYSSESNDYINKLYLDQVKADNILQYDEKDEEYNLILETDPEIVKCKMEYERLVNLLGYVRIRDYDRIKGYFENKGWDINYPPRNFVKLIEGEAKDAEKKYLKSTSKIRGLITRNQSAKNKALTKGDIYNEGIRSSIQTHSSASSPTISYVGPDISSGLGIDMRDLDEKEKSYIRAPLDETISFLQKNMHESIWEGLNISIKHYSGPPAYISLKDTDVDNPDKRTGLIMLNDTFTHPPDDCLFHQNISNTLIHEFGHAIEDLHPKIHEAALKFLMDRTKGQPIEHKITSAGEYDVIPDNFPIAYCGRMYPGNKNTEIISNGLQMMAKPGRFLENDPEYFQFIYDVMQGKYND